MSKRKIGLGEMNATACVSLCFRSLVAMTFVCLRSLRYGVCVTVLAVMSLVLPVAAVAALSEARVYEQVSPQYKGGYAVTGNGEVAVGGGAVRFNSLGAFAGSGESFGVNSYVASRTESGWVTSGLYPSPSNGECWKAIEESTPDMSRFQYLVTPGATATACVFSPTNTLWVRGQDGSAFQASPPLTDVSGLEHGVAVLAASSSLSRFIVQSHDEPVAHLVQTQCGEQFNDERQEGNELFEVAGCELRPVGVDEQDRQVSFYCSTELGRGSYGAFGALSQPAGSEVFFSVATNSRTPPTSGCGDEDTHPIQLFVRIAGRQSLSVATPLPGTCDQEPCAAAAKAMPKDAIFQGATEDGSRVFFTTSQPLVNEDRDAGNDLYMAMIGCATGLGEACGTTPRKILSLTRLSRDPRPGEPANVKNSVVAINPDGSHVYVVAEGDLVEESARQALEEAGRAVPRLGAENLYVYDTATDKPTFIADLCSGPEESGNVNDRACPTGLDTTVNLGSRNDSGLWTTARHEAQTVHDGTSLVFASYGQLVGSGPERDADTAKDLYRYDVRSERLQRVSVGESGSDANGNNNRFDAGIGLKGFAGTLPEQYELPSRSVSDEGDTVVFGTSEPLSSLATNGREDVYVWHAGSVGLVSSGSGTEDDEVVGISQTGQDVFFATSAGLVSADSDGLRDIYDARVKGGVPPPPAVTEACSGDACQGPLSTPSPVIVPGSVSQSAGGNFRKTVVKHKQKVTKRRGAKSRKRRGSGKKSNGAAKGGRGR